MGVLLSDFEDNAKIIHYISFCSFVCVIIKSASWTLMKLNFSDKANINIYRQKGPLRYAQPPAGTYASTSGFVGEVSAPSTNFTTPPSGFAPSPFMHPPSTGTGSLPIPGSYVQSASSSPFTQQSPSQGPPVTPVFSPPVGGFYRPVQHHWCYVKAVEGREVWYTFSRKDSHKLEEQFLKGELLVQGD